MGPETVTEQAPKQSITLVCSRDAIGGSQTTRPTAIQQQGPQHSITGFGCDDLPLGRAPTIQAPHVEMGNTSTGLGQASASEGRGAGQHG
eukprot:2672023-Rhodomonas_salina.1